MHVIRDTALGPGAGRNPKLPMRHQQVEGLERQTIHHPSVSALPKWGRHRRLTDGWVINNAV